jgi:acyl carrier protein
MSNPQDIQERVTIVVTDVLQAQIPAAETNLIGAGLLDSLGFVEMIARLEREFAIRISLENIEIDQLSSIRAIAAFVAGARESAAAGSQ